MEISTFELLIKPIAPLDSPVARRVVQGYFLTISNLEQQDLFFAIEFFVSLPDNPADPDAENRFPNNDNVVLLYDVAGANVPLTLFRVSPPSNRYIGIFFLPAGKTATVELLPNLAKISKPNLEIRGYAALSLLPIFTLKPPFIVPQRPEPAKVLLNAEIRGTFLPNSFQLPNTINLRDADFDQINYSLSLASGKALNLITPKQYTPLSIPGNIKDLREAIKTKQFDLGKLSDLDNSRMLLAVLDQLELTKEDLASLKGLLPDSDISVKISNGSVVNSQILSSIQ